MTQTILYNTSGITQFLVALPVDNLMGGYRAFFPEVPGAEVNLLKAVQLRPGPEYIEVYQVTLKAQEAVQPFIVRKVASPFHPALLPPLISGTAHLVAHPPLQTGTVQVEYPLDDSVKQPVFLALPDQSGSTGYHWVRHSTGALKVSDKLFPGDQPGEPGIELFSILPTEPGFPTLQIQLQPPDQKAEPIFSAEVCLHAKPLNS